MDWEELWIALFAFSAALVKTLPKLIEHLLSKMSARTIKDLAWVYAQLSFIREVTNAHSVALCKTINGGGRPQLGHQIHYMECYKTEQNGEINECFQKKVLDSKMSTVISKSIASKIVPISTMLLGKFDQKKYEKKGVSFIVLYHVTLTPKSFYYLCIEFDDKIVNDPEVNRKVVELANGIGSRIKG